MKHYVIKHFITYQITPSKEQISDDLSHRFQVSAVHWLAHYCICILYVIVLLLTFVDNNHLLGSEFAFAALLESFALQLLAALGMDNATDLASLYFVAHCFVSFLAYYFLLTFVWNHFEMLIWSIAPCRHFIASPDLCCCYCSFEGCCCSCHSCFFCFF